MKFIHFVQKDTTYECAESNDPILRILADFFMEDSETWEGHEVMKEWALNPKYVAAQGPRIFLEKREDNVVLYYTSDYCEINQIEQKECHLPVSQFVDMIGRWEKICNLSFKPDGLLFSHENDKFSILFQTDPKNLDL